MTPSENAESRYGSVAFGDPLDVLGEEATEVAHAVFKLRRFGPDGTPFGQNNGKPKPKEMLIQEIGDFLVILNICVRRGLFSVDAIERACDAKEKRLFELYGPAVILG